MANATTTAYKVDRRYFSTVLNNEIVQPGVNGRAQRVEDLDKGLFTNFRQGSLYATNKNTDLALNGTGFFTVENPESGEVFYTRDGRFKINSENELVTSLGFNVLDDSGAPILIRERPFFVDTDGSIFVRGQEIATISVVDFEDHNVMLKKGDNLYALKEEAQQVSPENTSIQQGSLEESNVNIVEEMVHLIQLNRTFESSQKALTAQDQTLAKLVSQVPKF
jgi:flagellar basal-body rod protein FlgG